MNAGDSKTVSFKSRMSILLEKKPPNKVYISEELDDLLKKYSMYLSYIVSRFLVHVKFFQ